MNLLQDVSKDYIKDSYIQHVLKIIVAIPAARGRYGARRPPCRTSASVAQVAISGKSHWRDAHGSHRSLQLLSSLGVPHVNVLPAAVCTISMLRKLKLLHLGAARPA